MWTCPVKIQAADEVIADAGFCVAPTVDALTTQLDAALGGARPPTSPTEHAGGYDWDAIAAQAETAYRRAIDGAWEKHRSDLSGQSKDHI